MRNVPGLYVDADISDGIRATEFIREFFTQTNTPAYKRTVIETTHRVFSKEFDRHMSRVARVAPERFHHVYEYSPSGSAYSWIGVQKQQLWAHTIRYRAGHSANFSWTWKPAKQYNPTYRQRRTARVGWDAIRALPKKNFDRLVENSAGRRYKFIWRAPMLEYGIHREVRVKNAKALMIPVFTGAGEAKAIFKKYTNLSVQQPGDTTGNFTQEWTKYWNEQVPDQWDEVIGKAIAKDGSERIAKGISSGNKVRSRNKTFSASAVVNEREAFASGRAQAIAAIKGHQRSIAGIESIKGVIHDFG